MRSTLLAALFCMMSYRTLLVGPTGSGCGQLAAAPFDDQLEYVLGSSLSVYELVRDSLPLSDDTWGL